MPLEIFGSELVHTLDANRGWRLKISDLILIAEYSTNEGPYVDDYFFIFVTLENGAVYFSTCSFYQRNFEVLNPLGNIIGAKLEPKLVRFTDWESRVIWPPQLAGDDYYTFREVPPASLWQRIQARVVGPIREYTISKRVRDYIESRKTQSLSQPL